MKILAAFFSVVGPLLFWMIVILAITSSLDSQEKRKGDTLFSVVALVVFGGISLAAISFSERLDFGRSLIYLVTFPLQLIGMIF